MSRKAVSSGKRVVLVGSVVGLLLATGAFIGSSNQAGWTCTSPPLLCTLASDTYPIGISLSSTLMGGVGWSIENNGNLLVREHNPSIGPGYPRTKITAGGGRLSILAVDFDGSLMLPKVGIGTTPEWALDVNGNIHIPQGNYLSFLNQGWAIGKDHNAAVGDVESLQIEGWGGATWGTSQKRTFQIISQTGTAPYTNHVVLQANLNDGNVGVGTTEPEEKLDVNGNVVIRGKALEVTGGAGSYVKVGKPQIGYSTTFSYEYDQASGMFDTYISNPCGKGMDCDLILDFPYGNVGIGTTNPQSALQVDGDPGYLQIDSINTTPATTDCNENAEIGRMLLQDPNYLWVCTSAGWKSVSL